MEVNGKSFEGVRHAEAFEILSSSERLFMIVRREKTSPSIEPATEPNLQEEVNVLNISLNISLQEAYSYACPVQRSGTKTKLINILKCKKSIHTSCNFLEKRICSVCAQLIKQQTKKPLFFCHTTFT